MKKTVLILCALTLLAAGCRKGPGPGGKATITGTVTEQTWEEIWCDGSPACITCSPAPCWENATFIEETPAVGVDVYISYGTNDQYDDKTETDINGTYRFDYLLTGDYTIFVYSQDPDLQPACENCNRLTIEKNALVKVSSRKEEVSAPELVIYDFRN